MSQAQQLVCIQCPLGCDLLVSSAEHNDLRIDGCSVPNCKAGRRYAQAEVTDPRRTVTTSVRVRGGDSPLLAVRTKQPIPKRLMLECLKQLQSVTVDAPVERGAIVLANIAGSGIDVIASRSVSVA